MRTQKVAMLAVLDDGRVIDLVAENLGWNDVAQKYVTRFSFTQGCAYSYVNLPRHRKYLCPDPALRLSRDKAFIEHIINTAYEAA